MRNLGGKQSVLWAIGKQSIAGRALNKFPSENQSYSQAFLPYANLLRCMTARFQKIFLEEPITSPGKTPYFNVYRKTCFLLTFTFNGSYTKRKLCCVSPVPSHRRVRFQRRPPGLPSSCFQLRGAIFWVKPRLCSSPVAILSLQLKRFF